MRPQEIKKLKKLCNSLDLDWQEYDYIASNYQTIKEQILKKAFIKTKQMEEEDMLAWDGVAEYYDTRALEEKFYVPEEMQYKVEFLNCLVLRFSVRDFGFAVNIVKTKFRGNLMNMSKRVLETNRKAANKTRILWFIGVKEVTNMILHELESHQIRPRILRNSFFPRHFLHYANGKIYPVKRTVFKHMMKKQSAKLETEEKRIQREMFT